MAATNIYRTLTVLALLQVILVNKASSASCRTEEWRENNDTQFFNCDSKQYLSCISVAYGALDGGFVFFDECQCGLQMQCAKSLQELHLDLSGRPKPCSNETQHTDFFIEVSGCTLGTLRIVQDTGVSLNLHSTAQELDRIRLYSLANHWRVNLAENNLSLVPRLSIPTLLPVHVLLNNNRISKLGEKAFENLTIQHLDLSDNFLTVVTRNVLKSAKRMDNLILRNNHITEIEEGSFAETSISEIDLSGNFLVTVSRNLFSQLPYLKSLVLSDNKIQWIETPNAFLNCNMLTIIDLSQNLLEHIGSHTFMSLPRLRTLILSFNKLSTAGQGSFHGLSLGLLDISHNPMQTLNKAWFRNTNVTRIDANNCQFQEFPFKAVVLLEESIKEINLSRNSIRTLPLSNPNGKGFDIEILDLSYNVIDELTCLSFGDSLKSIYLNNNSISSIERCNVTERMFSLARFSLAHNPLNCCELQWLYDIVWKANTSTILDEKDTLCMTTIDQSLCEPSLSQTEKFVSDNLNTTATADPWTEEHIAADTTLVKVTALLVAIIVVAVPLGAVLGLLILLSPCICLTFFAISKGKQATASFDNTKCTGAELGPVSTTVPETLPYGPLYDDVRTETTISMASIPMTHLGTSCGKASEEGRRLHCNEAMPEDLYIYSDVEQMTHMTPATEPYLPLTERSVSEETGDVQLYDALEPGY